MTKSPLGQPIGAFGVGPVQVAIESEIASWMIVERKALRLLISTFIVGVVRVRECFGVGPALVTPLVMGSLCLERFPKYLQ